MRIETKEPQFGRSICYATIRQERIDDFGNRFLRSLIAHFVGNYCSTIEAGYQSPLENRVPPSVDILERTRFFLHLLVVPPPFNQRLQHAADDPDAPCAQMVSQLGNRESIELTARTVERLRGDVVLHHDARIQGGEIELVEAFVHPHLRFEREAATVPAEEILRVLEILRSILLPHHETAVVVRLIYLHRRERGAGREPRLLLRRQRRKTRQFREAREIAFTKREVPAVQMQPAAQDVLARFVDDLPVREV